MIVLEKPQIVRDVGRDDCERGERTDSRIQEEQDYGPWIEKGQRRPKHSSELRNISAIVPEESVLQDRCGMRGHPREQTEAVDCSESEGALASGITHRFKRIESDHPDERDNGILRASGHEHTKAKPGGARLDFRA